MVVTVHTGKTNVTAETLSSIPIMTLGSICPLTSQLISIMYTESRRGVYIKHLVDPGRIAAGQAIDYTVFTAQSPKYFSSSSLFKTVTNLQ